MPLQNRVTPFGEIVAYAERGSWMGNRGILHNDQRLLTTRRWSTHSWIICLLEFKGRRRKPMSPATYTELFFLDEATALAAGHRPCGECHRAAYNHFKACWISGNNRPATIHEIDHELHRERVHSRTRAKVTFRADVDVLPDGTFIAVDDVAYLVWQDSLWRWTPKGYQERRPKPRSGLVTVLTPQSTVRAIAAGYIPMVFGIEDLDTIKVLYHS